MAERLPDVDPASARLLLSVVDLGSISKAADRHGLTQPSASRRIRDLERRLGVRLLERTPAGAVLSSDGALLAESLRSLVSTSQDLIDSADTLRSRERRPIALGVAHLVARFDLPRLVASSADVLADVDLTVSLADTLTCATGVRDGRFDLALVDGPREPVGLSSLVLSEHTMVLVVGRTHPWARRRRPVSVEELESTPMWLPPRGSGSLDVIDEAVNAAGAQHRIHAAGWVDSDERVALAALGVHPAIVRADTTAHWLGRRSDDAILATVACAVTFVQPVRLVWKGRRPSVAEARTLADRWSNR